MTSRIVRYATAAALAAGTLVSTAAFAQEAGYELASASVNTADVNIATAEGRAIVERRIRNAAQAVCGDAGDRNLKIAAHAQACSKEAITIAQRSLESAVARAQSGTQVASLAVIDAAAAQ